MRKAPGKTTYTGVDRSEEMSHTDELAEQVLEAYVPFYRTTKAQVIEGYKKEYGEDTSKWATQAAKNMYDTNPGMYKSVKNARRNFEGGRENKGAASKSKTQWSNMGKNLPPMGFKPPSSFTITFVLDIKISQNCGHIRGPYTVYIGGDDAQEFAKHPTWDMIMAYYFGDGGPPDYDNPVEDICAILMLRVS